MRDTRDRTLLTKEEIIKMVKQLGMMHILYLVYRDLENFRRKNIKNKFICAMPDSSNVIIQMLSKEDMLINKLDEWEKKIKDKKKSIF